MLTKNKLTASNKVDYFNSCRDELMERILLLYEKSNFYKRLFRRVVQKYASSNDFKYDFYNNNVPFTIKEDLIKTYPFGFLCTDLSNISEYYESSGTTDGTISSSRTSSLKTKEDIELDIERRIPDFINIEQDDFVIIHLPYAYTSSGSSFHKAFTARGAICVAADQGHIFSSYTRLYELMVNLKVKVLITSDPYLLRSIILYDKKKDIFELESLKYILTVGVTLSNKRIQETNQKYKIKILPFYGLSEFGAVGIPCENGHIHISDDFFVETYNPNYNDDEEMRSVGEIVISDLLSIGTPMFRYRTRDVGSIEFKKCECGSYSPVLEIHGRLKDLIKDDNRYLSIADFQDLFLGLTKTSEIFQLSITDNTPYNQLKIHLKVQQYEKSEEEIAILIDRIKHLTNIPYELSVYKHGELFEDVYNQRLYRETQTVKNLSFHDERRQQWIITY